MPDNEPHPIAVPFRQRVAILLVAFSFAVPISALSLGGLVQLGHWPSAAAPFGFNRVAIAYVLLGAPLVWWTASRLARWCQSFWQPLTLLGIIAGLLLAASTIGNSSYTKSEFGETWLARHFVRVIWVVALQFPWALSAKLLWTRRRVDSPSESTHNNEPKRRLYDLAIMVLLITVVPPTFTDFVVRRQMIILDAAMRNLQLRPALRVVSCLNSFDCSLPEYSPDDKEVSSRARNRRLQRNNLVLRAQQIREAIFKTETRIARYPANTTDEQKVGLALDYYSLGDFDQAEHILSQNSLATDHEWGALVMGYVAEQRRHPVVAAENYQRAIELEAASESPRPNRLNSAYERLANSLRASRQGHKVEAVLRAGKEEFPDIADRLTLQLGEHYIQAGRSQEAANTFSRLAARDDMLGARAKSQLEAINSSIGSCFVRMPNIARSRDASP